VKFGCVFSVLCENCVVPFVMGGRPRQRGGAQGGGVPRERSSMGATRQGAKRHGTMESTRGHRASSSDDGDGLERSDEGWLDDCASAGTPC
jgi:hypothetical protein